MQIDIPRFIKHLVVRDIDGVEVVNVSDRTFLMHLGGTIEMASKHPIRNRDDLSMAYTPGVARVRLLGGPLGRLLGALRDPDAEIRVRAAAGLIDLIRKGFFGKD